jgi:hypothetical protein
MSRPFGGAVSAIPLGSCIAISPYRCVSVAERGALINRLLRHASRQCRLRLTPLDGGAVARRGPLSRLFRLLPLIERPGGGVGRAKNSLRSKRSRTPPPPSSPAEMTEWAGALLDHNLPSRSPNMQEHGVRSVQATASTASTKLLRMSIAARRPLRARSQRRARQVIWRAPCDQGRRNRRERNGTTYTSLSQVPRPYRHPAPAC